MLLHMDLGGTKLGPGKSGRRERGDVLGKLSDCPFLKSNELVQYIDGMEDINLESLFVVLRGESWYRSVVRHGDDTVTVVLRRLLLNAPKASTTIRVNAFYWAVHHPPLLSPLPQFSEC